MPGRGMFREFSELDVDNPFQMKAACLGLQWRHDYSKGAAWIRKEARVKLLAMRLCGVEGRAMAPKG